MSPVATRKEISVNSQVTQYLSTGDTSGPLLIFVHGWPDVGETWRLQAEACAALGFHVLVPDMRGYGGSSAPRDRAAYALELIVGDMVALLREESRGKAAKTAVWVGHDWGSGVVSALAGHHPELVAGLVLLSVPYRTIDLGLDHIVTLVNRQIYPAEEYPYGQFEYMKAYQVDPEGSDAVLDQQGAKAYKIFYRPANAELFGKPGRNARALRDGLLAGAQLPDIPLEATTMDEALYEGLLGTFKKNGFYPATSYYLNDTANVAYSKTVVNGGVLDCPVLFINAKHDAVCSTDTTPELGTEMRRTCKNLTEHTVDAGHWAHREKPAEVNALLTNWLQTALPLGVSPATAGSTRL